jgi:predicted glutamine amidotransferase
MCGIAGVTFNMESNISNDLGTEVFRNLLAENTSRGKDSTGICYLEKNHYQVLRGFLPGVCAEKMVITEKETTGLIGHTRHATVGSKTEYDNVHPFSTEKYIGVHNGTIFNYKELKEKFEIETTGECDSEVVYRILDKFGMKGLEDVEGTYALVFVEKENPSVINIFTNGSKPMQFMYIEDVFTSFGSIAKSTYKFWKDFCDNTDIKHIIYDIKPCVLYKLEDGIVKSRDDFSKTIKLMTEKEGEALYRKKFPKKYDYSGYNGWEDDIYNRTGTGSSTYQSSMNFGKSIVQTDDGLAPGQFNSHNELISTFSKLFESCYVSYNNNTTVYIDINALVIPITFESKVPLDKFLEENMNRTKLSPSCNPLFGYCGESKDGKHRLFCSEFLSTLKLLTAISHASQVMLVSTAGMQLPPVEDLIASLFANINHDESLKDISKYVKEQLINTNILNGEYLYFQNESTKNAYLTTQPYVLSYRSPVGSYFNFNKLYQSNPIHESELKNILDEGFTAYKHKPINTNDVLTYSHDWFYMLLLNKITENLVAGSDKRILSGGSFVTYDLINDVAKDLVGSVFTGQADKFADFTEKVRNIWKTGNPIHNKISYNYTVIRAAAREDLMCVYGQLPSLYNEPLISNNITKANEGTDGLVSETGIKLIYRAVKLREYSVCGNTTKPEPMSIVEKS